MDKDNKTFRSKVFSHLSQLAKESPAYEDAKMLVGSADTVASLKNNTVHRFIDTEWIEKIEYTIPYLDAFIRNPGIAIQENEEILPVEATKKVSEKSIRYLSQHTNHILKIEGDEVTPSKLLNVFRDETYLTYENKFINTLLVRLIAFIEKRFSVLNGTSGFEKNYVFDYQTSFHHSLIDSEKNSAKMTLKIELTSPVKDNLTDEEVQSNIEYTEILQRLYRIRASVMSFMASPLIAAVGKNYIRPPVIRTNPILKNKNLNACLTLWEYIESVDKSGFATVTDEFKEMPSDEYISELYSSVALQYLQFYSGVVGEDADNRLLSERRLSETFPDFEAELDLEEIDDYKVYDTDYKKLISASALFEKRRKLSEDERKIRVAIEVALRADRNLFDKFMEEELARKKAEEERRQAEEALLAKLREKEERRKNIQYRYIRTFLARLIQSEDELKNNYGIIKNKFLSYSKVKSRISKKCESFNFGRTNLAKLDVKGKKIDLYLALDPKEFEDKAKFYNFVDVSEKKKDTPMLMKVNGPIKLKRALELIEILMEKHGVTLLDNYVEQDYYMPYEETDRLVRRGLIVDLWNQTQMEEPVEEASEQVSEQAKLEIKARYVRSYLARLIQSDDKVKSSYGEIKNKLLSYKKVKSRLSKKRETFYIGRETLVKLDVKGKKIDLYLALDPKEFEDKAKFYNFVDISEKKKDTPMLMKVNGPIKLKRALELIEILMEKHGVTLLDNYVEQDYYMPYEETDRLVRRGLIVDLWNQTQMEEPVEEASEQVSEQAKLEIKARYIRSYLARLIQSDDKVKSSYSAIKNKLLSYKKVKSRLSKKRETFYIGRETLVKLDVKGKKIDLYLALDPKEFEDKAKFYNFIDVSEKKKDTPMLMKVNGPIKLKRALELIEILMEKHGVTLLDNYVEQDYYMPYEETETLIARGLIVNLMQEETSQEIRLDSVALTDESSLQEALRENEGYFNGEKCVFKPYFKGYKEADLVIIPVKEDAFNRFNEKKKQRIFKSALKKYQKRLKKKSK